MLIWGKINMFLAFKVNLGEKGPLVCMVKHDKLDLRLRLTRPKKKIYNEVKVPRIRTGTKPVKRDWM